MEYSTLSTTGHAKKTIRPASIKIILLCAAWYTVSSITSQLSKAILTQFRYPLTLSQFQFITTSFLCCLTTRILYDNTSFRELFPKGSIPSKEALGSNKFVVQPSKPIIAKTLPMGIFQFVGKFFSHAATSLVPVSTVSSIKTLSPLLVVLTYRVYYNVKFPLSTYATLIPIAAGVMLIVTKDAHNFIIADALGSTEDIKGCVFAFISCFVFVVQNIYGKKVVTYNSSKLKNNPALLALASAEKHQQLLPLSNNNSSTSLDKFDEKTNLEFEKLEHYKNLSVPPQKLLYQNHNRSYDDDVYNSTGQSELQSPKNSNVKLDKLTVLFYCSILGSLFSLPAFMYSELPSIIEILSNPKPTNSLSPTALLEDISNGLVAPNIEDNALFQNNQNALVTIPWVLLFLNGLSHFTQALLSFHILGLIPTVTYSIVSLLKRIVIITISMLWVNKTISSVQFLGLVLIGFGLYAYDKYGGGGSFGGKDNKKNVISAELLLSKSTSPVPMGTTTYSSTYPPSFQPQSRPDIMINDAKI